MPPEKKVKNDKGRLVPLSENDSGLELNEWRDRGKGERKSESK